MTAPTRSVLRHLAGSWPLPVDPDEELDTALRTLGAAVDGETVVRAGNAAGVLCAAVAAAVVLLVGGEPLGAGLLGVAAGGTARLALGCGPVVAADVRRTRAVGAATGLVGRAVLRMRVDPTAERAAAFAARTGAGPLADSLDDHCRRACGTARTGLDSFAAEWAPWFPALERSADLIEAAAAAPPEERVETLERALATVLDGTRDRVAEFAAGVRAPATGLYAFGVLLPLALVGLVPAAGAAGLRLTVWGFVAVYDVLLPAALVVGSLHLLRGRPVAFPPPQVGRSHPDVPDRRLAAPVAGVVVGVVAWVAAGRLVAAWAAPVGAVGLGVGTALFAYYRPVEAVRERVRAVEAGLDDALYLVGRRVASGTAVETAVASAGEEVTGATGEVFADAAGVARRLGVGVRESFLGDHGALRAVPSPRARSAAALLGLAASEGRPAGDALVATATHLRDLRRLEREARRDLAEVTGTLSNTAAVFGPLVGGATVALAAGVEGGAAAGAPPPSGTALATGTIPVTALGPAVGAYVLLLSVVLSALATALRSGADRALLGYRVGRSLLAATPTFLAAVLAGRLLV